MAKDMTKSAKRPVALEKGVKDMDAMARPKERQAYGAVDSAMMNNQNRRMQDHDGDMPMPNGQGYN